MHFSVLTFLGCHVSTKYTCPKFIFISIIPSKGLESIYFTVVARQKGLWTRMFHRPQSNKRLVCDFSQVPYFFELRFYLTWKTRCAVYLFLRRFNQRIEVEMLCNFYSFLKAPRHWGYSFLFNSHNHHRKFTISILQLETPRDSEFPRDSVLKDQAARIALLLSLGALETLSYLV